MDDANSHRLFESYLRTLRGHFASTLVLRAQEADERVRTICVETIHLCGNRAVQSHCSRWMIPSESLRVFITYPGRIIYSCSLLFACSVFSCVQKHVAYAWLCLDIFPCRVPPFGGDTVRIKDLDQSVQARGCLIYLIDVFFSLFLPRKEWRKASV